MRKTLSALTLTALTLIGSSIPAVASDAKVARGTITAMAGQSLTLNAGDHEMTFSVDSATVVEARGGSTKMTRAMASGKPGIHLADVLKTGQAVAVTYNDMAGGFHATEIKAVPKSDLPNANPSMRSSGAVASLGEDWITIKGNSGGGASFEQTFKVDGHTRVFAKGAGTAAAKKGGRVPFGEIVSAGDRITVDYSKYGNVILASEIHVTMKAQ